MTVVFDDEDLYTALKVEAARSHRPAKDIVAEALQAWLRSRDGAEVPRQRPGPRTGRNGQMETRPQAADRGSNRIAREATIR